MSSRLSFTLTDAIQTHFSLIGQNCAPCEDIQWVLSRWPIFEYQQRELTSTDIRQIKKIIAIVPTGKQRSYQKALSDILYYLQDACHWQLPEQEQESIHDRDYEWFESIASKSQQASLLFHRYAQQKEHYWTARGSLSPAFIAVMIGFDIAPLPLRHIREILNNKTTITSETTPRLRIIHQTSDNEEPNVTHYHLPLMSLRLLSDYHVQSTTEITERDLQQQLTHWAASAATMNRLDWSKLFQISWYLRYRLPPILLKDLAIPERHVSLPLECQASVLTASDIYAIDWKANWFESFSQTERKTHWPHRALLKHTSSNTRAILPAWDRDNVLPRLLYDYTQQLLQFGGVKKSTLAISSIVKYTHLEHVLTPYPLSYPDALNEDAINQWAYQVYHSLTSDSQQQTFVYFLRFLSFQEQTDSIDLTQFNPPTTAPAVSPARLDMAQLDTLIQTLINSNSTHPFRSLFAVVATLLGFFCMLRRGEVLRLRCKDIQFVPKTGLLTATVTNTEEGKTKSGQPRTVYTTIPTGYRKLFQSIGAIKKGADPDSPYLAFVGEKIHSRQLYYLLPVTRALKMLFGTHMKFHHLRHSGVHVLMLQLLHFVSHTPESHRGDCELEREILSDQSIATRFDYWLEGRSYHEVNDGIFFDEACRQIGHEHYATTRWSYLHDIDWLLPIVSHAHQPYTVRGYTHAELRYLFGLSPHSNDLSRRLKRLIPDYEKKSLGAKRSQPIQLTISALRAAALTKSPAPQTSPKVDHFRDWQHSIHTSEDTLIGFLFKSMLRNQALDLPAISHIWSRGCQHDVYPIEKKQRTALRNLPSIGLSEDGDSLFMILACNIKNARAFTAAFRHKDWQWLTFEFELSVNRKINQVRQTELLKQHYVQGKESLRIVQHPIGQTALTIQFKPKVPLSKQTLIFVHQFITSLQSTKGIAL